MFDLHYNYDPKATHLKRRALTYYYFLEYYIHFNKSH